jgi:hypothetical protein
MRAAAFDFDVLAASKKSAIRLKKALISSCAVRVKVGESGDKLAPSFAADTR